MKKKTPKVNINKDEISIEYEKREPLYKELCKQSLFILEKRLNESTVKIHSIPFRIKKLKSYLEKIDRHQIEKPFEEIDDIVGLRVICLFLSDIEKIGGLIRKNFEVIKEDDKIENSRFASFGYLSVHFIVKLGNAYKETIYADISNIPFEIQVRTIAMDAWANISHYLDYKTDQDIPIELKRDFYALNGMFYVADKHFQLFFEQREEKQEEISEVFEKGSKEDIFSQPINLDTLIVYLRDKFPDREHADANRVSELVNQLTEAGYQTIREIEELVDDGMDAFNLEEEISPPDSGKYGDIGVVRSIARISNDNFLLIWCNHDEESFNREKITLAKYRKLLKNSK